MEHRIGEMVKGLIRAIDKQDWKEIKRLVHMGGNLNASYDIHRTTPFMYAMTVFHKAKEIEALINLGGDVKYKNRKGETALMIAVENGCEAIVPWVMVDYGADLDVQDAWGNTPIMRCIKSKNFMKSKKLLYALIDYGADITNKKDQNGSTGWDLLWERMK